MHCGPSGRVNLGPETISQKSKTKVLNPSRLLLLSSSLEQRRRPRLHGLVGKLKVVARLHGDGRAQGTNVFTAASAWCMLPLRCVLHSTMCCIFSSSLICLVRALAQGYQFSTPLCGCVLRAAPSRHRGLLLPC